MSHNLLGFNVINQEMMCLGSFLLLIDHWDKSDVGSVVVYLFKRKMNIASLRLLLQFDEINEGHSLGVVAQDLVVLGLEVILSENDYFSIVINDWFTVVCT